jgi:predicted secreted protein with PEFG-CTERM motif
MIFVLSFFVLPAFSQTSSLISVQVSNKIFEEGQTIVISGNVTTVVGETPVTIQIFHQGNLIEIAQLDVAQDGSFTDTVLAQGPQWQIEGEYTVRASYGEGNIAEASFEYFKKQSVDTTDIFEVDAGAFGTFDVHYTIRGGTVTNMLVDPEIFALIVVIEPTSDGSITVSLPRESIDAKKLDGTDDTYIILIDGVEVPFQEIQTDENTRVITIGFEEGDSDIEIIGTFVIPEFGAIAALILAVAIISIVIISKKRPNFAFDYLSK